MSDPIRLQAAPHQHSGWPGETDRDDVELADDRTATRHQVVQSRLVEREREQRAEVLDEDRPPGDVGRRAHRRGRSEHAGDIAPVRPLHRALGRDRDRRDDPDHAQSGGRRHPERSQSRTAADRRQAAADDHGGRQPQPDDVARDQRVDAGRDEQQGEPEPGESEASRDQRPAALRPDPPDPADPALGPDRRAQTSIPSPSAASANAMNLSNCRSGAFVPIRNWGMI